MGEEWAESNDVGEEMLGTIEGIADGLEFLGKAAAAVVAARLAGTIGATTIAFVQHQVAQQAVIARYAAMNGITPLAARGLMGVAVAARGASAALAFLGGPIGAIVTAGAGLAYVLDQYSEKAETAEERSRRLADEVENLAGAWNSLGRAQLEVEIIEQSAQAFDILPQKIAATKAEIESAVRSLNQTLASRNRAGRGQSEFSYLDKDVIAARQAIKDLEDELSSLTEQQELSAKSVDRLKEVLAGLGEVGKAAGDELNAAGSAASSSADDFLKVADAIGLQILELSAGAEAAERYQLIQRVGRDLTEEEIKQLDSLLAACQRLRAEREAEIAAERFGNQARRLGFELELEIGGEEARIEDQMFERLSIIDNALAAERISKEEHRQLELLAEQAYQDELTRLNAEAEQQRTQLAMQEAQARRAATESMLAGLSGVFGNFAEIAKQGGEETFGTYKALASAQAAISAAVAINRALADGGPFLGPALAVSIAALTGAQIAAINKQQYSPRAVGGQVIGGNQYLVGERGPELITMGANGNVTPYNQLMREARGSQQAPQQSVRVIIENYGNEKATTSESVVNDERIIRVVVGNINARREIHSAITRTTSASNKVGA